MFPKMVTGVEAQALQVNGRFLVGSTDSGTCTVVFCTVGDFIQIFVAAGTAASLSFTANDTSPLSIVLDSAPLALLHSFLPPSPQATLSSSAVTGENGTTYSGSWEFQPPNTIAFIPEVPLPAPDVFTIGSRPTNISTLAYLGGYIYGGGE